MQARQMQTTEAGAIGTEVNSVIIDPEAQQLFHATGWHPSEIIWNFLQDKSRKSMLYIDGEPMIRIHMDATNGRITISAVSTDNTRDRARRYQDGMATMSRLKHAI